MTIAKGNWMRSAKVFFDSLFRIDAGIFRVCDKIFPRNWAALAILETAFCVLAIIPVFSLPVPACFIPMACALFMQVGLRGTVLKRNAKEGIASRLPLKNKCLLIASMSMKVIAAIICLRFSYEINLHSGFPGNDDPYFTGRFIITEMFFIPLLVLDLADRALLLLLGPYEFKFLPLVMALSAGLILVPKVYWCENFENIKQDISDNMSIKAGDKLNIVRQFTLMGRHVEKSAQKGKLQLEPGYYRVSTSGIIQDLIWPPRGHLASISFIPSAPDSAPINVGLGASAPRGGGMLRIPGPLHG